MKKEITRERLLELGGSLQGIIQELLEATETPVPNPRKRRNLKAERVAKFLNYLDARDAKRKLNNK